MRKCKTAISHEICGIGLAIGATVFGACAGSPAKPDDCAYSITPASYVAPASGGSTSVSINTGVSCSWQALSGANWIGFSTSNGITAGAAGVGPSTLLVQVAPNGIGTRAATLAVANKSFEVQQAGGSVSSPVNATMSVTVDGGTCSGRAVNVTVFIDSQSAGTIQPGAGTVSKSVAIGNHTIAAQSSNGLSWAGFMVAVPAGGYATNLTCK